jgi:phosphoglycolate phosphatase
VPTPPPRLLVLWDVDHTLIETRGLGGKLYQAAFEEITGRSMQHKAEVTGRTERAILAETLRLHDLEPSNDYQARYARALAEQYELHIDDLRRVGRALPGAAEALAAVAELPGVVQTVLTGNLRAVVVTKLRAFNLDRHLDFDIGAYADDDEDRPELVPIAQHRAAAKHHTTFNKGNTIILGDSPSDVETAAEGGAQVIGIATGKSTSDELVKAGAATTLDSLEDCESVLRALRQTVRRQ